MLDVRCRKIVWSLILGSWLLIPTGCHRTKPQVPANRKVAVDSTALSAALMAQRLVEEANIAVAQFVHQLDSAYVLETGGYWRRIVHRTVGNILQKEEHVDIHTRVYSLQGSMLVDAQQTVQVGKKEVPAAIDDILLQMRRGEVVSLIVPWYAAFGASGTAQVPAYENIRIEMKVETL